VVLFLSCRASCGVVLVVCVCVTCFSSYKSMARATPTSFGTGEPEASWCGRFVGLRGSG